MLRQLRATKFLGLISIVTLLLLGCNAPMVIDREAQGAILTDSAWHQQWKDSNRLEETRVILGREVTIRAVSQLALWTLNDKAAIAMASTPQLAVFGIDANPVANLTDEQLVQFIIDTALSQTGEVLGLQLPKSPSLQKERDESIQASIGSLTGSQFRIESNGVAVTVLILRVKSGSDHVVVLGLIPNSKDNASLEAVIDAVTGIKHPG